MKGADLHPKDHSIQLFTDASNEGWGAHLDQNSTKGLWSDREKRLHINVLELKAVSLALRDFKDQCQNQTVLVHTSCRLICHSPEPQAPTVRVSYPRPKGLGHRCSKHKPDQPHSLCVPSYGSLSQGDPKDQAMPLPDHRNSPRLARGALVLGPSAALNRDPTTTPSVNDSTQTVPQVCVPQQPPAPEPPRLVSRSGQLQEQGFSVEVAERIAAPQRSSTRTIYKSKWALFEKWCRENSVDFSTPSVKQISDFFMYLDH